jgi:hypothetical protein
VAAWEPSFSFPLLTSPGTCDSVPAIALFCAGIPGVEDPAVDLLVTKLGKVDRLAELFRRVNVAGDVMRERALLCASSCLSLSRRALFSIL